MFFFISARCRPPIWSLRSTHRDEPTGLRLSRYARTAPRRRPLLTAWRPSAAALRRWASRRRETAPISAAGAGGAEVAALQSEHMLARFLFFRRKNKKRNFFFAKQRKNLRKNIFREAKNIFSSFLRHQRKKDFST